MSRLSDCFAFLRLYGGLLGTWLADAGLNFTITLSGPCADEAFALFVVRPLRWTRTGFKGTGKGDGIEADALGFAEGTIATVWVPKETARLVVK